MKGALPSSKALFRCIQVLMWASVLLLFFSIMHPGTGLAASPETFTAERSFQGLIRRDMAERIALAEAEQLAMQGAMRILVRDQHFRFATEGLPPSSLPPLEGLAAKLFSTRNTVLGMRGFPPNMEAYAEVVLIPPSSLRKALQTALVDRDSLDLYALILSRQAALIAAYDGLASNAMLLNPQSGGWRKEHNQLNAVIRNLNALDIVYEALKDYQKGWMDPEKAYGELLKARELAPRDPLILTLLAELALHFNRPGEALELVGLAVNEAPGFARAHDVKGMILIRQFLPILAVESFNRAIELDPLKASYFLHRATAHLMQEETDKVCEDFRHACYLGDCSGYQWGREEKLCPSPFGQEEAPAGAQ